MKNTRRGLLYRRPAVSGRCVGLSLDTAEAHPVLGEGIDRADIQSKDSLTTKLVPPNCSWTLSIDIPGLLWVRWHVPGLGPPSATLPTSLAPVTLLREGIWALGPERGKQSPCSYAEARTIWPTASASGDLASQVFQPQVGCTVLLFISFSGNFFWERWGKQAQGLSTCSLWPARTQCVISTRVFLLCVPFFFLFVPFFPGEIKWSNISVEGQRRHDRELF